MTIKPVLAAGALAVGLTACAGASSSGPSFTPASSYPVSAAAACSDFAAWAHSYLVTRQGQYPMTGYALLHKAGTEAPSGPLYTDLSELDLAVANPPPGASPVITDPGSGTPNTYLLAVDTHTGTVAGDCSTVNPRD